MIKKISELVVGRIYQAVTGNYREFAYLFMYDGDDIEEGTVFINRDGFLDKLGQSSSLNIHNNSSFEYYVEATVKQQDYYYQIIDTKPQQLINFLP